MNIPTALVLLPAFWPNMPPLGITTLKGYLKSKNITSCAIDYNNKPFYFNEALENVMRFDTAGFSCYKSNIKSTLEFSSELKKRKPSIKIILGGPEITLDYISKNDSYGKFADHLVIGEGELPLELIITGKCTEKLITFEESPNLAAPDYSDINFLDYPVKNAVCLLTSRGCIRNCAFCSEKLLYKKYKTCKIETVTDHIRYLKQKGIERFIFNDSLVNGNLDYFNSLLDSIINNFKNIPWEAQIAVRNDMNDEIFNKMKQSGCYNLFVGLESGCDRTLKNMNKGFDSASALRFFNKLSEHNLTFGVSMIMGFPGETESDFAESLNFILSNKKLIKKIEQVNPFIAYRGTGFDDKYDYGAPGGSFKIRDIPAICENTVIPRQESGVFCGGDKYNSEAVKRTDIFVKEMKKNGIKYTKAFINNLTGQ